MSSVYDISSMYDSYKQSVQSATGSKAQSALNAVNSDSTDEEPAKDLKPILYKRSLNRRAKW